MCGTCGCGSSDAPEFTIDGADIHKSLNDQRNHTDVLHRIDVRGRLVKVEQDLLAKNAAYANGNHRLFAESGVFAVNLVSSPGSGKTTLVHRTALDLKGQLSLAVIEGDQRTSRDAERIRATGVPAVQINTGKICHLDAHMIGHAVQRLDLARGTALIIENVGNLVCPAGFDLGERHKVVVVSVTEGEDKPLKYPDMFAAADLMIVNKIDLLEHVEFDVANCVAYARRINPDIEVMELSATKGQGLLAWYEWLSAGVTAATSTAAAE